MTPMYYQQAYNTGANEIMAGFFVIMIGMIFIPFLAGLLWTFGVHMAGQREERFVSYFGVTCLCTLTSLIYLTLMGVIMSSGRINIDGDPRGFVFMLSFIFFVLQSFLSVLFGKLVWRSSWTQSLLTWLIPLILFFIVNLVFWVEMFSR